MSVPYIEVSPINVYHFEEDVFWIVTKDEDDETARAMFFSLDDAREYLHKVKGIPLEEIKIVAGEDGVIDHMGRPLPLPDHHRDCPHGQSGWAMCTCEELKARDIRNAKALDEAFDDLKD